MRKTLNILAICADLLAIGVALASCQKENAYPEAPEVHVFHVELDATVADTKATYATALKQITFESGDALYVALTQPASATWSAATGTLTYDGTSFKGDITYTGTYGGSDIITDAKDLTATFLPKNYSMVNYLSATGATTATNAFYAGNKDAAVPQLVHLTALVSNQAGNSKSPLTLIPNNAVLFYTITADALSAGVHTVSVSNTNGTLINGEVTAKAGSATTFAVAFPSDAIARTYIMSIPGYSNVAKSGKTVAAGKVCNISTPVTVNSTPLSGVFSISSTETVKFSQGNLQATYNGSAWSWSFASKQDDYIGKVASNTSINGNGTVSANGTVDLFGWSTSASPLGINNATSSSTYSGDFADWGSSATVQAGIGTGWRTLSKEEWKYVLNTRDITNRYCKATVDSKAGLVIFPDSYTHPAGVNAVDSANTEDAAFTTNNWAADDWAQMETAGAVFLPMAGFRYGSSVYNVSTDAYYWSSTPYNTNIAYGLNFTASYVNPSYCGDRSYGHYVRLVQNN